MLVRIAIFLTLVSASVVSLALVGQATDFDGRFDVFTLVLFSIQPIGTLTSRMAAITDSGPICL